MTARVTVQNPFPGLRPFGANDSTLFFGRDEQTGEALERMLRQRLLAVVGVSGCGKSSLVGAGMVPALEMGLAGDPEQRWRVATMRPGDGPLRELGRCLGFRGEALAERTYGLLRAVETHLPGGENLLLVVDQFEELFPFRDRKLREGAGSEADLFVSYLLRAAQDPAGRVYVLLTMRSDYSGECAKFHGLPEALNDGQYLVPRMTRQQLQEAIESPLTATGVEIHPAVVQDLLNRCDEEPDNLPLLQHLLRRLFEQWEEDGGQGPIRAAMLRKLGGLAEALNRDAETVYGGLSTGEKTVAEELFRRITESRRTDREDDDRPVRRPQMVADLARLARVSETALRDTVRSFEERGLLVVRKTDRGDMVDLPHECLCLKWRRLKEWIRSEAEDAKKLLFLLDAVGKSHLTGLALSQALEWRSGGRFDREWCLRYLSAGQRSGVLAWVTASQRLVEETAEKDRQQHERERRHAIMQARLARWVAMVFGVALLIASVLVIYAYCQRRVAVRLAAEAKESLSTLNGFRQQVLRQNGWSAERIQNVLPGSAVIARSLEANNKLLELPSKASPLSIVYYPKPADPTEAVEVLQRYWKSFGYRATIGAAKNQEATNFLRFREPVPLVDLQRIALSLIRAGIELRAIKNLGTPGSKVVSIGYDIEYSTHPPWTPAEIMAATQFNSPRIGIDQAYVAVKSPSDEMARRAVGFLTARAVAHTITTGPTGAVVTIATRLRSKPSATQLESEMQASGIPCEIRYP